MALKSEQLRTRPKRPEGVYPYVVNRTLTGNLVPINGYTMRQSQVLSSTIDELEIQIDYATYDRMESDSTIIKDKQILVTNVLSDDMQLAPGATEDEVGDQEFSVYLEIMYFCQRMVANLVQPYRVTLEQLLGNGIKYGHGIAEIEWELTQDEPSSRPQKQKAPQKSAFRAFVDKFTFSSKEGDDNKLNDQSLSIRLNDLRSKQIRLLPRAIWVKPRDAANFVCDNTTMEVIGLVPRRTRTGTTVQEIIDRDKFLIFTVNKQDEDPRGRSSYRQAFNWFNLKAQVPAEMLRFILQEAVPQAVGTLPEDAVAFEFERDANGDIVYNDPDTMQSPKMKTAAESMHDQIKNFRSGSGAVIPAGAKLEPFKKAGGQSNADFFQKILKTIDDQIENVILLQTLAQSEGQHQNKAAATQVAELLYAKIFWLKWGLAMMTLNDLFEVGVVNNFGEWALKYLPQVSFGDFIRRDWNKDLASLADAYFKGLLDDTQRAAIMSWMGLPPAGPSRQEVLAQLDPTTGNPVMPNQQRPDKQGANKKRNDGNSTEKQNDKNKKSEDSGGRPVNLLGDYGRGFVRSARNIFSGLK